MTQEMLNTVQKNILANSKTIVDLSKRTVPRIRSCFEQKPFRPIWAERDHIEIILKNNILLYDKHGKQIFSWDNWIYWTVRRPYSLVAKNFGSIEEQKLLETEDSSSMHKYTFKNGFLIRNMKLIHAWKWEIMNSEYYDDTP